MQIDKSENFTTSNKCWDPNPYFSSVFWLHNWTSTHKFWFDSEMTILYLINPWWFLVILFLLTFLPISIFFYKRGRQSMLSWSFQKAINKISFLKIQKNCQIFFKSSLPRKYILTSLMDAPLLSMTLNIHDKPINSSSFIYTHTEWTNNPTSIPCTFHEWR